MILLVKFLYKIFVVIIAILILIIFVVIAAIAFGITDSTNTPWIFEAPEKRAGRLGEYEATGAIESVLREDDYLFTNISISYKGRQTELDNVVVNKYGVFIIEAKNYKGCLVGEEDDYKWVKYKENRYGNTFKEEVKNPIKQVKRQIYILAKYLENHDERTWIEGYAILVEGNSPVESNLILKSTNAIDEAIHTPGQRPLSKQKIEKIKKILSEAKTKGL